MSLTKKAYAAVSDTYERSLSDGVKKENGVFYTDLPLAEKMLRELALPPGAVVMDKTTPRLIQFHTFKMP